MFYAEVVLLWLGTLAALAFLLIYGIGARWWSNAVGCFLMAQGAFIFLLFLRSIIVSFLLPGPIPITIASFVTALVLALLEVSQATVFARLLWRHRRKS